MEITDALVDPDDALICGLACKKHVYWNNSNVEDDFLIVHHPISMKQSQL